MRWLDFAELDAASARLDQAVAATPGIDHFCSSSDWILPARLAFAPQGEAMVFESDAGFAPLMALRIVAGLRAGFPLEASWCLASPFLGAAPELVAAELLDALRTRPPRIGPVQALVLSGIPPGGPVMAALALASRRELALTATPTDRVIASLEGGFDGFLARRSPKMRAGLRRARRAAAAAGIVFERHVVLPESVEPFFARIVAIEARSWKSAEGGGMEPGPMQDFYRAMLPRLAARGALRIVFVTRDGADLAFCFGGLFGHGYRGLQASYDDAHSRFAPGVLAHLEMIAMLCDEGIASYDLGSDMDYKRRWGEAGLRTVTCLVVP